MLRSGTQPVLRSRSDSHPPVMMRGAGSGGDSPSLGAASGREAAAEFRRSSQGALGDRRRKLRRSLRRSGIGRQLRRSGSRRRAGASRTRQRRARRCRVVREQPSPGGVTGRSAFAPNPRSSLTRLITSSDSNGLLRTRTLLIVARAPRQRHQMRLWSAESARPGAPGLCMKAAS